MTVSPESFSLDGVAAIALVPILPNNRPVVLLPQHSHSDTPDGTVIAQDEKLLAGAIATTIVHVGIFPRHDIGRLARWTGRRHAQGTTGYLPISHLIGWRQEETSPRLFFEDALRLF